MPNSQKQIYEQLIQWLPTLRSQKHTTDKAVSVKTHKNSGK